MELQEASGGSSILTRHPSMSDSTVDWSLLYGAKNPDIASPGKKDRQFKAKAARNRRGLQRLPQGTRS